MGMNQAGQFSAISLPAMATVLLNPFVLLGFLMYGLSTVLWLMALSRKDLSFVYPFISLTYILVLVLSSLVLREGIGTGKILGIIFIVIGLIAIARL